MHSEQCDRQLGCAHCRVCLRLYQPLRTMNRLVRIGEVGRGIIILTFGHWPFLRSLNQVVSTSVLMFGCIYTHTNTQARLLDILTKSQIPL